MANSMKLIHTKLSPNLIRSICRTIPSNKAWLSKLLVRKIKPTEKLYSRMLSDEDAIYALQTHNYRPDSKDAYLNNVKNTVELIKTQPTLGNHVSLVGSWTVDVGDQDQALHLWQYSGGFAKIDEASEILNKDQDYQSLLLEQGKMVCSRHLQYLSAFSYWPQMKKREPSNIYEIRSYVLKPGNMIEWGNNWKRAINYRKNNDEPFSALFSQIGQLYNVHHIWCYKDLKMWKETRESAWRRPGWDECAAYTMPLIREMDCRILIPTPFSPTQ